MLSELHVAHNRLESLPEAIIEGLTKLQALHAAGNALKELPNAMRNLYFLDISSNRFDRLPGFLAELPELCDIDVSFNKLRALPESWDSKECEFSGLLIV